MYKQFFPYQILLLVFVVSCNKQTVEDFDVDFGYDYFPLEVGKYLIYESDSIIYDPIAEGTEVLITKTFVKEAITDTVVDNSGNTWYRVERSDRKDPEDSWVLKRILWLSRTESQALRNEDNLRFISMIFPAQEGVQWDGNAFFDETLIIPVAGESVEMYKSWSYEILSVGAAFEEEGLSFPDVIEVSMADNENLIERRFAREAYARGIGLVFRELLILDTQCQVCCNGDFALCEGIPWENKAEKGFILRQKLIDYN